MEKLYSREKIPVLNAHQMYGKKKEKSFVLRAKEL